VFHKVSGDEFYEVSYPLRGPQTATFLISKPPFAKDEFVWSGVDFKDGIHFENGERRLSDLLASTREERHAARARRERAAAAKESADRAASERRETAEREERMARDRADAEAGRKAALDDAASGREGKRSEVLDGIAQLRRDLAATDAEFTRTRERFDAEKRDLTAHWDQVLADEIARNREFQLKGVTDTEERRRVEEQLKVDDETSRTSIKQRLDEVLGDLATRRVRSVPPLERKSADLKAALGAAEAAQAAKLEEIERSYATECQSVEASFKDRMAALGADTLR
jgi:hypothetical protein